MTNKQQLLLLLLLSISCLSFVFYGCTDDDFNDPFISRYEPVYLSRADFENAVAIKKTVAIGTSGKIYLKDSLLFINEINKGFHVFDNSDPTDPKAVAFLETPGATDMAIRNSIIYINQATDLIAIEYNAQTNQVALSKRIQNTFPELRSPDGFDRFYFDLPEDAIITDWIIKE